MFEAKDIAFIIRFGAITLAMLVVFTPLLVILNKRGVVEFAKEAYRGTDKQADDKEIGRAVSHIIKLVGVALMSVMIIITFVFQFDFGDWKTIIAVVVLGAELGDIAPSLPGIISAFKGKKVE